MINIIFYRLLLEYGASVLRVVDGRTIQVDKISLSNPISIGINALLAVNGKYFPVRLPRRR